MDRLQNPVGWYRSVASPATRDHIALNLKIGKYGIYMVSMLAAQYGFEEDSQMQAIADYIKSADLSIQPKSTSA